MKEKQISKAVIKDCPDFLIQIADTISIALLTEAAEIIQVLSNL